MREFYEGSLPVFRPFAPLLFILHNPPANLVVGGNLQGIDILACSPACALNQVPDLVDEREEGFCGAGDGIAVLVFHDLNSAPVPGESKFVRIRSAVGRVKVRGGLEEKSRSTHTETV